MDASTMLSGTTKQDFTLEQGGETEKKGNGKLVLLLVIAVPLLVGLSAVLGFWNGVLEMPERQSLQNHSKCGSVVALWYKKLGTVDFKYKGKDLTSRMRYTKAGLLTMNAVTFFGNLLVNTVILTNKKLMKQRTCVFMVALGFADVFFALFYDFSQFVYDFGIDDNYINCMVWNIFDGYCLGLPWFIFLGLNLDKLYAIKRPIGYHQLARTQNVLKPISLCWIVALIPILPLLFDTVNKTAFENGCGACTLPVENKIWVMWHGLTGMIIPAFVFLLIWVMIGHTLAGATGDITRFLKVATAKIVGLTIFFVLCLGPFCCVFFSFVLFLPEDGFGMLRTFFLSKLNSMLQPFLFLAVNDEVRKAVVNVFREKILKRY